MKKLLIFLCSDPYAGGGFQYAQTILEVLSDLKNDDINITIVYINKSWDNLIPLKIIEKYFLGKRNIINRILRVFLLHFPLGVFVYRNIGKYIDPFHRFIYKLKPDFILCPDGDSIGFEMNIASGYPIFDLMYIYEKKYPEVNSSRLFFSRNKYYQNICNYASIIFVDSKLGKEHVVANFRVDSSKIHILPYCAPSYIQNNVANMSTEKYNLPGKFILYPAQFWFHKNHKLIIEAINIIRQKSIEINAVFVGSPKNAYNSVHQLIKKYNLDNQIYELGYVKNEDLVALYKTAVALVMPSFLGPTNIPPLEAFALGCPVIVSNVYSMHDQVGDAAVLIDPNDPQQLADIILEIYFNEDTRKDLIEKGYRRHLSWNISHFKNRLEKVLSDNFLIKG
jgi:glycosyltransferase involved in cell wall biosynthesis